MMVEGMSSSEYGRKKLEGGYEKFIVEHLFGKNRLTIYKPDGSMLGVSISRMVGSSDATWHKQDVKHAFRQAAKGFKPKDGMSIHHEGKLFYELVGEFLALKGLKIEEVELGCTRHSFKDNKDQKLRDEWIDYHRKNAKITIMPIEEHEQLHVDELTNFKVNQKRNRNEGS
jgi:hypothetical protein